MNAGEVRRLIGYTSGSLLLDHTMHAFVDGEIGILCNHSYTNANAN